MDDRFVQLTEAEIDSPDFINMPPPELKAYLIFRRRANWHTGEASMADSFLARAMGLGNKRSARRIILRLLKAKRLELNTRTDANGNLEGGRGFGRRFSDYKVRNLTGEFLFTPAVKNNSPQRGKETPSEVNKNSPNTSIGITPSLNPDIESGRERFEGNDGASPLPSEPEGHQSRVRAIVTGMKVRGRAIQDLVDRISLQDAINAMAATRKAQKTGKLKGKGEKDVSAYFVATANSIQKERLGIKAGLKLGSANNPHPIQTAENLGAALRGGVGTASEVEPSAKRASGGVSVRRFSTENGKNGGGAKETKQIEDLNALIMNKRAASAARRGGAKSVSEVIQ